VVEFCSKEQYEARKMEPYPPRLQPRHTVRPRFSATGRLVYAPLSKYGRSEHAPPQ